MPIVQIWGLPLDYQEEQIESLYKEIVSAAAGVRELELNEDQFTFFFPSDRMQMDLGAEVICFVKGLFTKPERTDEVRNRLARVIGEVLKRHFPNALVECLVESFDPATGFWASAG